MSTRRAVRILLRPVVLLGILGVLFGAVNVVGERIAEDRIGILARDAFDLPSVPEVNLRAFPIVVRVFQGRIPGATLRARDVELADELVVRSVSLTLDGITAKGGLMSLVTDPDSAVLVVERGSAVAESGEAELNAFLAKERTGVTTTLLEGRVVARASRRVAGRSRRVVASGRLVLSGRTVSFEPLAVTLDGRPPPDEFRREAAQAARFRVELPELPGGIRVQRIEVHKGFVRLTASVRRYEFRTSDT